ncbi:MAG: hypothetical protein U9P72_00775 [Campylobacterota bacterium]|nr:hypothetical protein [Campylobacterota bacterium]
MFTHTFLEGTVFFIRIHGDNHPQQLKHLKVNGSEYALRPSNGGVMSSILSGASQSTSWGYVECVIKQKDIPQDVLNNGGIIKITLDNTDYDHHFYFGEHGTYFVNPKETVKD